MNLTSEPLALPSQEGVRRIGPPLLAISLALLAGIGILILFLFNPQQHGFYPFCMFHRMTGLLCPGCGSLRAMHELLHGRIGAGLRLNPLLVASIPFLAVWLYRQIRRPAGKPSTATSLSPFWIWVTMIVLLLFGIVRNLPFYQNSFASF